MTHSVSTFDAAAPEASLQDYIALLKPRVMSLVVFSGFAGIVMAPVTMHPLLAFVAVLSIAMASGASGAINMWYERVLDGKMLRTKNRPLPQGRIPPEHALEFGLVLLAFSVFLMFIAVNALAAGLLLAASAFYVYIYTIWLKPRTPQNIVIGGAAGAFPPMIGWAAATGQVSWESFVLFALIFLWTPPHFWALALYRNEDYTRAGIPMMPVVKGAKRTKIEMLVYTLLLLPASLLPVWMGFGSMFYGAVAALLGLGFVASAVWVLKDKTHRASMFMFRYSLFYLSALFTALMIGKLAGWA